MAYSDAQRKMLLDPQLRQRLPGLSDKFEQIDKILSTMGWGCSRIPARYKVIVDAIRRDPALLAWAIKQYPGVDFGATPAKKKPVTSAAVPPPPVRQTAKEVRQMNVGGGVRRAIAILEKRKKRSR